jgi:hypothetical protein
MTVFQLLVYSCVTINAPISGELLQKSCNWSPRGLLFASEEACRKAAPAVGSDVFSDVADGRKVEKTNCVSQSVLQ